MNIVVLFKAVPVVGTERLDERSLTQRAAGLEANGNDEYVLEAALKLTEAHGGDVTLLSMGPQNALEPMRKALAMGAARAVHVQDDQIRGSDTPATVMLLAAALRKLEFDLAFCGADTSDGQGGVVAAALAARLGLPYLSYASKIEPGADGASVRVLRLSSTGYDVLEAPTPALVMGTQVLGEPRYPSLRGIMQARNKPMETWSLSDLGIEAQAVGPGEATTRVVGAEAPPPRGGAQVLRGSADEVVPQIVDFLAARRLI